MHVLYQLQDCCSGLKWLLCRSHGGWLQRSKVAAVRQRGWLQRSKVAAVRQRGWLQRSKVAAVRQRGWLQRSKVAAVSPTWLDTDLSTYCVNINL